MSAAAPATSWITTEEMLALPENGTDRWLIRGLLREKPMTVRNRRHSYIMGRAAMFLNIWRDRQPEPRGEVFCGEVGCRLRRGPDTTVGIDVAYVSPETAAAQGEKSTLIEGVPVLVVEILSPSDQKGEIDEMVDSYLQAGVSLLWVIDPHDETVLVYRPGQVPELVTVNHELNGDPHLPGFRVAAGELF